MNKGGESDSPAASAEEPSPEAQRVAELEERIEALGELGDRELGSFTAVDWVLITLLGAIAPLILLYWGAP